MPNILQYPICLFGILHNGLICVNVNPLYTKREFEYQLRDPGVKAIVVFNNAASKLQQIIDNTDIENVITTVIGDLLRFPKSLLTKTVIKYIKKMEPNWDLPSAYNLNDILKKSNPEFFKPVQINTVDIDFLKYTGGTIGISKGAILTHGNILANLL